MKTLRTFPGQRVALGHQGENFALTVIFNIGAWADAYGPGTTHLVHMRTGDTEAYPVAVTQEGTEVSWEVSDADTAVDGYGKYELRYIVGETVVKSSVGETYVRKALQNGAETPEPVQGWLDHVAEKEHELLEAVNTAKEHSEKASASATDAAEYALKAKNSEENAAKNVQEALKQAKESGEFDGADGKDGKDGHTPVKGVDYFDGKDGKDGKDGQDGQDYVLTESDKEEIAEMAAEKVEIPENSGSGVEVTAKPGQLIRVKEADENGKPTAWEPVPWGWVEGGMVEVLTECQPNFDESAGVYFLPDNTPAMEAGNTYFVKWNGTEYVCTSQKINGIAALGDLYTLSDGQIGTAPTGEPFGMMYIDGLWGVMSLDGSTELTISISQKAEIPHPIPGKFLPDGVPYVEQSIVEILPECQFDATEENDGVFETSFSLTVGETYTVIFNGTEYTCVAQDVSAMAPGAVGIGDLSQIGLSGNGEPFFAVYIPGAGSMVVTREVPSTVTVSIIGGGKIGHPLDPVCLPDLTSLLFFDVTAEIAEDFKSATVDKSFAQIVAAYQSGKVCRTIGKHTSGSILFLPMIVYTETAVQFSTSNGTYTNLLTVKSDNTVHFLQYE